MNNKAIIRQYTDTCDLLKKDKSEEAKQRFMIIFNELDLQLSKDYDKRMEKLVTYKDNIKSEIKRMESVLELTKMRIENRERMLKDYKKYIGYIPRKKDLKPLECAEKEKEYQDYKTYLSKANDLVDELSKSEKRLSSLKAQLEKRIRNRESLEKDIVKAEKDANRHFENLKKNEKALGALYDYCHNAPFNENNAYFLHLLIQTQKVTKGEVHAPIKKRETN